MKALDATEMNPRDESPSGWRFGLALGAILFVFILACLYTGYNYYQKQRTEALDAAGRQLQAVAAVESSEIENWRQERESDAALFLNPLVARNIEIALLNATSSGHKTGLSLMAWLQQHGQYEEIWLLDNTLTVRHAAPASAAGIPSDASALQLAAQALQTNRVLFSSLHRMDGESKVVLDIAVPLLAPAASLSFETNSVSTNDSQIAGVVLLQVNANTFLFPKLHQMPGFSASAEMLLLQREGKELVFLNEPRQPDDTALMVRRPMQEPDSVGALAARGGRGILEGKDQRGARVLAAARSVPGTPWILMAKVNEDEICAPLSADVINFVFTRLSLLLAAVLAMSWVWRNRECRFAARRLALQQETAEQCRQHASRMQKFASATFEGVVISEAGRFVELNDQFLAIVGYRQNELIGKKIESVVASGFRENVNQAIETDREIQYESKLQRKDGAEVDVEVRARMSLWEGRKVRITAVRDVTGRKKQERELRRLSRLNQMLGRVNRAIVSSSDRQQLFDSSCLAALDCGFVMAWVGWFDPQTKTVQPQSSAGDTENYLSSVRIVLDGRVESRGLAGTAIATGSPDVVNDFLGEARLQPWHELARAKGFLAAASFPLRLGGAVCGTLTVYASEKDCFQQPDVELLKEVSRDISFALDRLEQEAERRRIEEQLRQAQKMEVIGSLVGGVTHDFNNILTAVLIHLSLLKEEVGTHPEQGELLLELEHEIMRGAALTRQLLLFARKKTAQLKPLDLDQTIADLAKMLRRILGPAIQLVTEGCAGAAQIQGDAGMMEQVIMNLCINARDAMPHGGYLTLGTAVVELADAATQGNTRARAGRFVCLTVRDTGCGMDEKVLTRLFEPFFTTKELGKGTGLGLSTVYGIIKEHEGWIDVQSQVGRGTTFSVFLPLFVGPTRTSSTSELLHPMPGGSETILYVENDLSVRRPSALWLRRLGYAVFEAGNASEAAAVWDKHHSRIHLLLTDVVMPGTMNGLELAASLRQARPALKLIVSSGYHADAVTGPDRGSGCQIIHLEKPYDAAKLAKAVRSCLDQPPGSMIAKQAG